MTREEAIEQIADILEAELDEVTDEARLESFEAWDSIAVLGVISMITDATGKYPHADEIKDLAMIGDLMKLLEIA